MEPGEFAEMAMAIKDVFKMKGVKDTIIDQELPARHNYHSGLYCCSSYPAGHKININNLEARQPLGDSINALTGIEFEQIKDKILAMDVKAGEQLLKTHFKILD